MTGFAVIFSLPSRTGLHIRMPEGKRYTEAAELIALGEKLRWNFQKDATLNGLHIHEYHRPGMQSEAMMPGTRDRPPMMMVAGPVRDSPDSVRVGL